MAVSGTDPTAVPGQNAKASQLNAILNAMVGIARQAIINGNFDIWQRGVTVTNPGSPTFLADRWRFNYDYQGGTPPTSIVASRQAVTPGDLLNSKYFFRLAPNGAGSGYGTAARYYLEQYIENGTKLLAGAGKSVTLSFKARSSIAGKKIGTCIIQNYGTGGSPSTDEIIQGKFHELTSSWQTYSVVIPLNTLSGKTFGTNDDDALRVIFDFAYGSANASALYGDSGTQTFGGSGTIDIAQVQLNAGDQILPFMARSPEEELRLCKRYLHRIDQNGSNSTRIGIGSAYTNAKVGLYVPVATPLRVINPTVQYSNLSDLQTSDGLNTSSITAVTSYTGPTSKENPFVEVTVPGGNVTQYRPYFFEFGLPGGGYFQLDAEMG